MKAVAPEGMQTITEDEREDTVGEDSEINEDGVRIDPAGDFEPPMRIKTHKKREVQDEEPDSDGYVAPKYKK